MSARLTFERITHGAIPATPVVGATLRSSETLDTFDASRITFTSGTGVVLGSTGTLAAFTLPNIATLTSFMFNAPNVTVFSVSNGMGKTATFSITFSRMCMA